MTYQSLGSNIQSGANEPYVRPVNLALRPSSWLLASGGLGLRDLSLYRLRYFRML